MKTIFALAVIFSLLILYSGCHDSYRHDDGYHHGYHHNHHHQEEHSAVLIVN